MAEAATVNAVKQALEKGKALERKFTQTVDLAILLKNVDLSVPKNRIDEDVILPKGRGKTAKVAVFAQGEGAAKAKKVADLVIQPDEFESLQKNKQQFKKTANGIHYFLAEAPLMAQIGKTLGVVLGPRGKMPRPIPPGGDPSGQVSNLRNTVKLRSKDKNVFHCVVGAEGMKAEDIADNVEAVLKRVESKLEHGRMNLGGVFIKTTMGPSVRVV
ncbi:MAG TPA: 50S ribosomal protein L1 [Candidatus Thermoplasmatota archaeon]|nr:50S ribosomal protein L1 [Candidatus Thermoplasmatota archaeon]